MTSACRPGISNALIVPSTTASASTCHTWTRPESVSSRQRECLEHGKRLRHDDQLVAREAVGRQAAQRAQRKHRDLRAEPGRAQQPLRVGQAVDQPGLRHVLHPGPHQRDDLAADEQPEIAVAQRPKRVRDAGSRLTDFRQLPGNGQRRFLPGLYRRSHRL